MSKPFKIEFRLGGAVSVPAQVSEDDLRKAGDPRIAIPADATRDDVFLSVQQMVYRTLAKNLTVPITIAEGNRLWIIPTHGVLAAVITDPEREDEGTGIGFLSPFQDADED
jgi:hypothetical protein